MKSDLITAFNFFDRKSLFARTEQSINNFTTYIESSPLLSRTGTSFSCDDLLMQCYSFKVWHVSSMLRSWLHAEVLLSSSFWASLYLVWWDVQSEVAILCVHFVWRQALCQLSLLRGSSFNSHLVLRRHPIQVISLVGSPPSILRLTNGTQKVLT